MPILRAAALLAVILLGARSALAVAPCCSVTRIDPHTGEVSARVNASGVEFTFKAANAGALHVGQPIYANLTTKQVSLDGRRACCAITAIGMAAPPAARPQPAPRPSITAAREPPRVAEPNLPAITFGQPRPVTQQGRPGLSRPLALGSHMLELRGEEGIAKAPGLPEGARKLLIMHVRTLPPGEIGQYIVDTQVAEEWLKTHPVPESFQPPKHKNSHAGCHAISMHCAQEAGKHAAYEASRQADKEWKHLGAELTHDWRMTQDCFADRTLHAGNIPVKFGIDPSYTQDFAKDGKGKGTSGSVQGSVRIGVPVNANFMAKVDLFYIPCLPFAVRPKLIGANGGMVVGADLGATATANGNFVRRFAVGGKIPVEVIPIVIATVPVGELEVSVYLEGNVEIGGEGSVNGRFGMHAEQPSAFDFECSGRGCRFNAHSVPGRPQTTHEQAEIRGKVHLKPAIYAALQLDFDHDVLTARAGPQPYLWGEMHGCSYGAATQTGATTTSSQEFHALTADLDWGLELRAEALGAEKPLGKPLVVELLNPHRQFLWFKDLAPGGSNALAAEVDGATRVSAGRRAAYLVKMRPCYPYTEDVEYHVTWTGAATPAAHPGCTWQSNQGSCWMNPLKGSDIDLVWARSGANTLTVIPVRDRHGRSFSARPTQISVLAQ